MKMRKRYSHGEETNLTLTAMIDIVFLLLIFFVMTFRIHVPEGDVSMRMPSPPAPSPGIGQMPLPPIRVELLADENGSLGGIRFQDRPLASLDEVRQKLVHAVQNWPEDMQEAEVKIFPDADLRYQHTIDAVTAVSAYRLEGETVPLIKHVLLARPGERPLR